jgi:hypothetical protein
MKRRMGTMPPYQDRSHPGNGPEYRTAKPCLECGQEAGTWWSHLWCVDCNIRRMARISASLSLPT